MMRIAVGLSALVIGLAPLFAQVRTEPPAAPRFGVRVEMDGIYVQDVDEDSAAALSGIRAGDVVIRCGEAEITDFDAIRAWIVGADATASHSMTLVRNGDKGAWDAKRKATFKFGDDKKIGIVIAEGLRITQVTPGSPAARAGLKAGDFLTRFGDVEAPTGDELAKEIRAQGARPGTVALAWIRDNEDREGRVRFGAARPGPVGLALPRSTPPPSQPRRPERTPPSPFAEFFEGTPMDEIEGIGAAATELDKAIALLRQKAGQDEDIARALRHVETSRERLKPLTRRLEGMERAMKRAEESLRGAMRLLDEFEGGFEVDDLMERFGELMEEGIDAESLQRLMESEFGEMIERLEIEEEDGRLRIEVEPKAKNKQKNKAKDKQKSK